ncbi:Predicted membrane protein [Sphingomonas guangdongensis]|uniref:Predicted membrane protein n=1 Tax=Sphingomonas guangdongensis TaxID=1141890 RepID=A0A285QC51_9SPHN|nr:DUF2306 domain-containing protein [Sphingomonas guangdongensis]SOB79098.1 Predicted membrane protein [Sphingomonas guangdongensis]
MTDITTGTLRVASWRASRLPRRGALGRALVYGLAVLVALFSLRYVLGLPPVPDGIALNRFRLFWLVLHASAASIALLLGGIQFSVALRVRRLGVHRWIGRVYVVTCLIGAISGLVLAIGTSAGPIAGLGFGGLAVAWLVTNALGWQRARAREFASHRRWMMRSWALTLAAVTLRIYMPLFEVLGVPELLGYRVIAFLCWLPNLAIAEALLARERHRATNRPALVRIW